MERKLNCPYRKKDILIDFFLFLLNLFGAIMHLNFFIKEDNIGTKTLFIVVYIMSFSMCYLGFKQRIKKYLNFFIIKYFI